MPDFRLSLPVFAFVAIAVIASPGDATAGVYKCVDDDGSISFSQTPCPNQVTTPVAIASNDRSSEAMECPHASAFALSVAHSMKRGKAAADTFSDYGGFNALSKSAVNIVNYVYAFQHSADVTADRIAALAKHKCQARAFGDVRCEDMPPAYVQRMGGCDVSRAAADESGQLPVGSPAEQASASIARPAEFSAPSDPSMRIRAREAKAEKEHLREACRARSQSEIDSINARMQSGYSSAQGERYRQRLRELREEGRRC